jgi:hypothetical protein
MRGNGTTSANLEQQVAAALADKRIGTDELEYLIDQVERGLAGAEQNAARQREAAFDPAVSPDLSAARQQLEDAVFLVGRLQTLRPRLERRLAEVLDAEAHARWLEDYEQVLAKRDEAVELFQNYPELVVQLLTILHTARNVDAEIDRVNHSAPSGEHRRLTGVECTARGITAFSTAVPSIAASVTLPDLENPGRTLWPPPQINPALLQVPAPDPRFSSAWGEVRDEERRAEREKAVHEREQFEADAEAAQRRSGAPVWWKRHNGNAME